MKLYFNENFEVVKRDEENIYRGSEKFNELHVYFPRNEFFKYHAIYPIFSYKRSDGREGGELAFTQSSSSDDEWYEWYDVLPKKALEVNGVLQITVIFKAVKNENDVIKKTVTGKALLTIKDAIVSDTDIIYTDSAENTVKSMITQIDAARVSIESLKAKYGSVNLGTIYQDPYSKDNVVLNAILSVGLCQFTYNNQSYLMLVDDMTAENEKIYQTVIYYDETGFIQFFHRILSATTWSLSDKKTLALDEKVDLKIYKVKEEVYENVYKKTQTYNRDEALLIGLIEVSEYDATTGELTVTYNPNTVDVTYDEDTGELVFSQKIFALDSGALPKKIRTLKLGLSEAEINNIKKELGKVEVDKVMSDISENPVGNKYIKSYIDSAVSNVDISKEKLISIIGNASHSSSGLLSIEDKIHLDTLVEMLENGDTTLVDTLTEVLAVFNTYPQGTDLFALLATKADKATTYTKQEVDTKVSEMETNIANQIAGALRGDY